MKFKARKNFEFTGPFNELHERYPNDAIGVLERFFKQDVAEFVRAGLKERGFELVSGDTMVSADIRGEQRRIEREERMKIRGAVIREIRE